MEVGYKQLFPDGSPTYFKEKITKPFNIWKARKMGGTCHFPDHIAVLEPKIHTIRADKTDRWAMFKGDIHHVYGSRTKKRRLFLVCPFVSWQPIIIQWNKVTGVNEKGHNVTVAWEQMVFVSGRVLTPDEIKTLAINDGFPSVEAFFKWFKHDFSGKILHWTNLRY